MTVPGAARCVHRYHRVGSGRTRGPRHEQSFASHFDADPERPVVRSVAKQAQAFAAPGACDAHVHVFGPSDVFPYADDRPFTPADAPKERLFALHALLGIERCVMVQSTCHGFDNAAIADAIAAKNGDYCGVALAPAVADNATLRRLDHMGRVDASLGLDQPAFRTLRTLLRNEFIWVKVSGCDRVTKTGPPYADAVPFARALVSEFGDRSVWGTDWPHPNHTHVPDDGVLVDLLAQIAPSEAMRRTLLVDNPQRLYRFPVKLERMGE